MTDLTTCPLCGVQLPEREADEHLVAHPVTQRVRPYTFNTYIEVTEHSGPCPHDGEREALITLELIADNVKLAIPLFPDEAEALQGMIQHQFDHHLPDALASIAADRPELPDGEM